MTAIALDHLVFMTEDPEEPCSFYAIPPLCTHVAVWKIVTTVSCPHFDARFCEKHKVEMTHQMEVSGRTSIMCRECNLSGIFRGFERINT